MFKISKPVKSILLLLAVIPFAAGCHVRLATKEDWITEPPVGSAAVTASATASAAFPELPTPSATAVAEGPEESPAAVPTVPSTATAAAKPVPTPFANPTVAPTEKPTSACPTATPVPKQTVTVSIMGPEGMLLNKTQLQYEQGVSKTVFDMTLAACEGQGLEVVYSGSVKRKNIYIEGIGGIYCDAPGGTGGWIYFVNGSFPSIDVSSYVLKDGDVVEWQYTR